jgi:hypothetical protein
VFEKDVLHSEGTTIYPVIVDIAEASESGSRQRQQPVELKLSELLPGRPAKPKPRTKAKPKSKAKSR